MPHRSSEARRHRSSLRTRLTLWVVAIFLLIQMLIGVGFWVYERATVDAIFEQRLLERAQMMAARVEDQMPGLTREQLTRVAQRELAFVEFEQFAVDLVTRDLESLVGEAPRWPGPARVLVEKLESGEETARLRLPDRPPELSLSGTQDAEAIAVRVRPAVGEFGYLIIVTSDAFVNNQMAVVTRVLVFGGIIGIAASALSGWFIAGIAVEPLHHLRGLARRLSPETIGESLETVSDDAELAALTAELDAARRRIGEAFAAQERFLSNISHEIKTPIATLMLESQTLDQSQLSEEAREFAATVEEEMRKLGRLVESFLTLTRVRDGKGPRNPKATFANEIVMDAFEDCLVMAEQHAVRLEPRLAESEAALEARVHGDPELLRTMLNNLIRNAIRFTPREGKVTVTASVVGEKFRVAVRDEGPGLPPELLDQIFDRFVQSSEELRRERGHGLGLAISKGIAELHDGDVWAANVEGGGAEFTVELPLIPGEPGVTGDPPQGTVLVEARASGPDPAA